MIAIRDRKGRLWTARLTVGAAKRMRDLAGLDVMELATDEDAERHLDGAPALAVDALFAWLLPECGRLGVTDRKFGRRFRGVPLRTVNDAIRSGVREFFRVPGPPPKRSAGSGRARTPAELWQEAERMAGLAGVDADTKTFGELVAASEGRRRHDWPRTALVLAQLRGLCGKRADAAALDPTGVLSEAGGGGRMEIRPDNLGVVAAIFGVG